MNKNYLNFIVIFTIFVSPFIFITNAHNFAHHPKAAFIQITSLLLLIALLFKKLIKKDFSFEISPILLPFFLFLSWMLLSFFYAKNRYLALFHSAYWVAPFIFFFVITNLFREEKYGLYLLYAIFFAGFLSSFFGILQFLFDINIVDQAIPPASFFANKNMAVHFTILTIPIGVVSFFHYQDRKRINFFAITSSLMFVFLLYTRTRAGWLSFSFELLVILFVLIKTKKLALNNRDKIIALFISALIIFFMISLDSSEKKSSYIDTAKSVTDLELNTNIQSRFTVWGNSINMIKDNFLLGVGMGNYVIFSAKYNASIYSKRIIASKGVDGVEVVNIHNDFLHIFAHLGFIGILLFLFFIVTFLKALVHLVFKREDLIFAGILASVVGIFINSLFSFPFELPIPIFIFIVYVAVTSIFYSKNKKYKLPSIFVFIAVFILIPFSVYAFNFHFKNMQFEKKIYKMKRLSYFKKWYLLLEESKEAITLNPYSEKGFFFKGVACSRLKKRECAYAAFYKILATYPNYTSAFLNIATMFGQDGSYIKAEHLYKKILEFKPTSIKAHYNLAITYMMKNEPNKAIKEFLITHKLDPKNIEVLRDLGQFYKRYGYFDEAKRYFKKCLAMNKNESYCKQELSSLN